MEDPKIHKETSIELWRKLKFGIIIHWGIYSVPGYDDPECASRRKIKNGSEWYAERLKKTFRETKADKLTKEFHEKEYKGLEYEDLVEYFNAYDFNVKYWVNLFEEVGAKYVILTTKHHDGYALWDTETTDFNSVKCKPHINIVEELTKELKKRNIKVGFYYSLMEFKRNFSKKYLNEIVKPQLKELRKYKPDIWFFDGDWKGTSEQWDLSSFISKIHKDGAVINDRLGKDKDNALYRTDAKPDYFNFGDRYIPDKKLNVPWEHITTIGNSWGINYDQREEDYKSVKELKRTYKEVIEKGGNFCLNLGPDADGNFDPREEDKIKEFGKWLKDNQSI